MEKNMAAEVIEVAVNINLILVAPPIYERTIEYLT